MAVYPKRFILVLVKHSCLPLGLNMPVPEDRPRFGPWSAR